MLLQEVAKAGQEEAKRLQALLDERQHQESERRTKHEQDFSSRLSAAEASRDAVDNERARAVSELLRVTQELEAKRAADAEYRSSVPILSMHVCVQRDP